MMERVLQERAAARSEITVNDDDSTAARRRAIQLLQLGLTTNEDMRLLTSYFLPTSDPVQPFMINELSYITWLAELFYYSIVADKRHHFIYGKHGVGIPPGIVEMKSDFLSLGHPQKNAWARICELAFELALAAGNGKHFILARTRSAVTQCERGSTSQWHNSERCKNRNLCDMS
jgi:hypothetical protein